MGVVSGIMRRIRLLVLLPMVLASRWAMAQEGGDLQAQIMYAFYIEDGNLLSGLVQSLTTQENAGGADDALRYHLAHAEYRSGVQGAERRSAAAAPAFADCIDQLKPLLEKAGDNVEAMTLQSACYVQLARLRKLQAVLLRSRAEERIRRAMELAPRNPRTALLRAEELLSHAAPGSADRARALGELQLAAEVFEQSTTTSVATPGWGNAETYLELGRQLEADGDFVAARNWIEKALIIAPDYKAAQRQLAALIRR
jgi:tetratricopeptide (TPR) repeat protein